MLSRYGMLTLHIAHYVLSMQMFIGSPTLKFCINVFVYRSSMILSGAALVETGLLLRVFALYHNKKFIRYFLIFFHIVCLCLQLVGHVRIIDRSLLPSQECTPLRAEQVNVILLGLGAGLSQASLLGMTLFKLTTEKLWEKTPLTSLMFREGICSFVFVVAMLMSVALYEYLRGMNSGVDLSELIFAFYILSLSLIAPRLTLHLRKLAMEHPLTPVAASSDRPLEWTKNISTLNSSICLTSFHE
jgi:hypothetical protein